MQTETNKTISVANGASVELKLSNNSGWTASAREEVIVALWTIAAIVAFDGGHNVLGWILTVKATTDAMCAIYATCVEVREAR